MVLLMGNLIQTVKKSEKNFQINTYNLSNKQNQKTTTLDQWECPGDMGLLKVKMVQAWEYTAKLLIKMD